MKTMKRLYLIMTLFFLFKFFCPIIVSGQKKGVNKKNHSFSIAYGYKTDTKWWREVFDKIQFEAPEKTEDILIKYEFEFKDKTGIGIEAVINDEFKGKDISFSEKYSCYARVVRFMPFVSYNLIKTKRFSFYTTIAAGLYFLKYKVVHAYPIDRNWMGLPFPFTADEEIMNKKQIGFDWAGGAGLKFFFKKNIGMFSEVGLNKSVFQIGVIVKPRK